MVLGYQSSPPPLDFSFKGLNEIESIRHEKPRRGIKNYKKSKSGRYASTSLRLNNNFIIEINGIHSIIYDLIEVPEKLTWLDLSFNRLVGLPMELTELASLKILYLHGNQLVDLPAIVKPLRLLPNLYSLTLHGNPLEERNNYRNRILSALPQLKCLDFNNVTSTDRKRIVSNNKRKQKTP